MIGREPEWKPPNSEGLVFIVGVNSPVEFRVLHNDVENKVSIILIRSSDQI